MLLKESFIIKSHNDTYLSGDTWKDKLEKATLFNEHNANLFVIQYYQDYPEEETKSTIEKILLCREMLLSTIPEPFKSMALI